MRHVSLILFGLCFLPLATPARAVDRQGDVGTYTADKLPHEADPAWNRYSGTARESIEDGK